MKIKMTMQPSGLLNGKTWPEVGEEIDVPDVVAVDLLNAGMAEAVESKPKTEKATAKPKATPRSRAKKAAEPAPAPDEPPAAPESVPDPASAPATSEE